MRYMRHLTSNGLSQPSGSNGWSPRLQSDGFRAMEEYADNHLGTRGYGHLQWTNIPGNFKPGGQRRTDFENWTKNQGLDASSFEANSGFLYTNLIKVKVYGLELVAPKISTQLLT